MAPPSSSSAVAVYCAASLGKRETFQLAALSVGRALAAAKRPLVYGGGNSGIMGIVSGAVMDSEHGQVTGVIPYAIHVAGGEKDKGDVAPATTGPVLDEKRRGKMETIIVNSMHDRKVEMAKRVGGFVGLPGGFGTFDEVLEVITWTQLNIHNKPVVLLNILGYFNPLRQLIQNGIKEGFIQPQNENLVIFVDGPKDHSLHDTFNWGHAALDALNSWDHATVETLPMVWTKDSDSSNIGNGGFMSQKARLLRKVWHIRTSSLPRAAA